MRWAMTVNFITLKWGTKYGPEYVNRLFWAIKGKYNGKYRFVCYTDDATGLDKSIIVKDINELPNFNSVIFTIVKIDLFVHFPYKGPRVLLDLDLLILKDLRPYFDEYQFKEPRLGYCRWQEPDRIFHSYHRGDCYVNSSFVTWKDDQFKYVYDTYMENKEVIDMKFKSFDKFMFYFCELNFHPKKIMYSYNFGAEYPDKVEPEKLYDEFYITIFNTSGINEGKEIHETTGWARDYWESSF
jgi:hypothetical protein